MMYTPITTVQHRKRASSRRFRRETIRYFHDAMRRFYRAHYAETYPRWVTTLIMVFISARERLEADNRRRVPLGAPNLGLRASVSTSSTAAKTASIVADVASADM